MKDEVKLLLGLAASLEAFSGTLRSLAGDIGPETNVEEEKTTKKKVEKAATTTKKKTAKKETKKEEVAEEPKASREVFLSSGTPPNTTAEKKLFKQQWKELGKAGQKQYIAGEINSLGEVLEAAEEPSEAADDFADMPEMDEADDWTLADVRKAAKARVKADGDKSFVVKLFKKFGYAQIADADPKDFGSIMVELEG